MVKASTKRAGDKGRGGGGGGVETVFSWSSYNYILLYSALEIMRRDESGVEKNKNK